MRVLIDECLPRRLVAALGTVSAKTVPDAGWAGKSNGELLALAEGEFDAFLTIDQNLVHQHQLESMRLGVIVVVAPSNRFEALTPLLPGILAALEEIGPGDVIHVGA